MGNHDRLVDHSLPDRGGLAVTEVHSDQCKIPILVDGRHIERDQLTNPGLTGGYVEVGDIRSMAGNRNNMSHSLVRGIVPWQTSQVVNPNGCAVVLSKDVSVVGDGIE